MANAKLLKVDVNIIDSKICNSSNSYKGRVGSSAFCAGSMNGLKDACQVI